MRDFMRICPPPVQPTPFALGLVHGLGRDVVIAPGEGRHGRLRHQLRIEGLFGFTGGEGLAGMAGSVRTFGSSASAPSQPPPAPDNLPRCLRTRDLEGAAVDGDAGHTATFAPFKTGMFSTRRATSQTIA